MRPAAILLAFAALLVPAVAAAAPIHTIFTHSEIAWQTLATAHFNVHFAPADEAAARLTAAVAEAAFARLTPEFGYAPDERYDIILRDSDDLANGITDPTDGTITLWLTPMDFNLRGNHRWLQNVVYHELTHMLHMRSADPSLLGARKWVGPIFTMPNALSPIWFIEGVAQYEAERGTEGWDSHRQMLLRAAVIEDRLLSYDKISVFGKNALEFEQAYNEGYALTRFLTARAGADAIGRVAREKNNNFIDFDRALELVGGQTGEQLYDSWVAVLRTEAETWGARAELNRPRPEIDRGWNDGDGVLSRDGRWLAYTSNDRQDFPRQLLFRRDRVSGAEQQLAEDVNSGLDISADGERVVYGKTEEDRDGNNFGDLFLWERGTTRRVTHGARVFAPAFFPDGERVAAVRQGGGRSAVVVVDVRSGAIAEVLAGGLEEQFFAPRVSPDGTRLLVAKFAGSNRELLMVDLATGAARPVPAPTNWHENSGDWLADDDIVFSADYEGVYDLFRWQRGDLYRLTRTTGGYFAPRVGGGEVVCASYTSRGYDLVTFDLKTAGLEPYAPPWREPEPAGEALEPESSPARPYASEFRSPYRLPWLSYDGSQLVVGLAASANDALSRHIFGLQSTYNFNKHNPYGQVQYVNRVWYPTFIVKGQVARRDYDELLPGKTNDATRRDDYSEQTRVIDLGAIVPVTNEVSLNFGGRWEKVTSREEIEYLEGRSAVPFEGNRASLRAGVRYSDLIPTTDLDIGITEGYIYQAELGRQVKALGGDFDYETYQASGEHYFPTPWHHHTLALKLAGGFSNGVTPMQGAFQLGGNNGLRGYGYNIYRGSNVVLGSAEYVFPLWYDIARTGGSFYFDGLYLSVFGDWGRAWESGWDWDELHAGYGGALTLKTTVYYSFPYHIQLGVAHGVDDAEDVRVFVGMGSIF